MKKMRISICLCLCLAMILSILSVHTEAYAYDKTEVTLNFIDNPTFQDNEVIYNVGDGIYYKIGLCYRTDEGTYTKVDLPASNDLKIDLNAENYFLYVRPGADSIESGSGYTGAMLYVGEELMDVSRNQYVVLDSLKYWDGETLKIRLEKYGPPTPGPTYPDKISIHGTFDGVGMNIRLNTERIGNEGSNITGVGKGYASGDINNLLQIQLAFGAGEIGTITVNGQSIAIPEGTKDTLAFSVAPASSYDIVVTMRKDQTEVPRTIIWESEKEHNTSLKDDELLKHGTIEILDVQDADGNSVGLDNVKQDMVKNYGWASILPGSKVIFRMTPDYGYQLTALLINDEKLTAREEQSTFEYIMPDTNVHICGIFEEVEDKVVTASTEVKTGEIQIDDSEIASGSVVLSVKDAELTEAQKAEFSKAATDYQIASYLNLDLDQVLYKGTADEVWNNSLNTLKNSATVKLQLAQGVDGKKIVIVHEKHDGTYEILPAIYDSATQTITFETTSFSNYAIAGKAESGNNGEKPSSGSDNDDKVKKPENTKDQNKANTASKDQKKNKSKISAAKTGDYGSAELYVMMLLFGVALVGGAGVMKKRR